MASYEIEDYVNVGNILLNIKTGQDAGIDELIKLYIPLLKKNCYLNGMLNEDLYSTLVIEFIRCVKKFKIDECYFLNIFRSMINGD